MNRRTLKRITDIAMTVVLLLLMAYSLVGEAAHEWLGIGIFILFILHHVLNARFSRNLFKGRYTAYRRSQTILAALAFTSMLGCMVSGIILNRYALSFLPVMGGQSWARVMHMVCSYWGFAIVGLHLGLHWRSMTGKLPQWTRYIGWFAAAYGLYAFLRRDIWRYMLLLDHFVFFDFDEPLAFFFLDYTAALGMFVFLGHCFAKRLKPTGLTDRQPERN